MTDGKANTEPKQRLTLDQKLAALRQAEAKIHEARRKRRTYGLIKIGSVLVAEAGASANILDWLHRLWLKTEAPRDREAIEIAADPLDVTKSPERQPTTSTTSNATKADESKVPAPDPSNVVSPPTVATIQRHQSQQPGQNSTELPKTDELRKASSVAPPTDLPVNKAASPAAMSLRSADKGA